MTALSKLKYVLATVFFLVVCVLTTAYQLKVNTKLDNVQVVLNFTYAALFVCAFLFGGITTGIAGVFGICFYVLLKNQSAWLALLGLVIGLVFGIIAKLTTYLIEKKKLDKSALFISAGAFFIAIGIVFTAAVMNATDHSYYIVKNSTTFIRFYWPEYVLPYIIGVMFIVIAFIHKKLKENLSQMFSISAFVSTSAITLYGIVCVLCSLKNKTFSLILANAYNSYFQNFIISIMVGLLIAIVLYVIGYAIVEIRLKVKNILKDAE